MTNAFGRCALIVGLLAIVFAMAMQRAAADPLAHQWFQYTNPHFLVLSDAPEAEVRQRINDLELFRAVVLTVTNAKPGPTTVPTEVYLFSSHGDFASSTPYTNIAGYMRPGLRAQYIVSGPELFELSTQQVLFHEYVHYLVRNGGGAGVQPPWYDEGLADMLASTQLRPDRVVLGGDFPMRTQSVDIQFHLSLRALIESSAVPHGNAYTSANFYGWAFALVNYLHLAQLGGGPDRLSQLQTYLQLISKSRPSEKLFVQAFDTDYGGMEHELYRFFRRQARPVLQLPLNVFTYDAVYQRRAIDKKALAYRLGYLVVNEVPKYAMQLFSSDGLQQTDARFRAGVGVAWQMQGNYEAADRDLRAALAMAPEDPIVLQEVADLQSAWCAQDKKPSDCPARLDEALDDYVHILKLKPGLLEAEFALGKLLVANDLEAKNAIALLNHVVLEAPWHVDANGYLGIALQRAGDNQRAVPFLRRAQSWTESTSPLNAEVSKALKAAEASVSTTAPAP